MKHAIYDLTKYPTTYDFAGWAVIARTHGVEHVHFIIDGPIAHWKYSEDIAWKRFATILLPICRLARLNYSVGGRVPGQEFSYHGGEVCRVFEKFGKVEKLKPTVMLDKAGFITITIRDSFRNKHRNSDRPAWEGVRKYLEDKGEEVVWIEDSEDRIWNLEHRMAFYSGAKMNLGVAQGPMSLCVFSDAPYITFNQNPKDTTGTAQYDIDKLLIKTGFPPGSQYNFRTDQQWLVWEPDTYQIIVPAFERMQSGAFARKEIAA